MSNRVDYVVDLDERGKFAATLYDSDTVLATINTEDLQWLVENYGVRHGRDRQGLMDYFLAVGLMDASDTFTILG
jgi:hypothetical protein